MCGAELGDDFDPKEEHVAMAVPRQARHHVDRHRQTVDVAHDEYDLLAWRVRRGEHGNLGRGLWLEGRGLLVGSEMLGISPRVRTAAKDRPL